MTTRFRWDVFVSHNRLQKPWVRSFVRQWRDLGLRVFFDEDSIDPGEEVVAGIERGITGSRHIVFFITPTSVESSWVALETSLSLTADPDARRRRLIPVMLEPTDSQRIRPAITRLNWIDLTDPATRVDRYHHLLKFLGVKERPDVPESPTRGRHLEVLNVSLSPTFGCHWIECSYVVDAVRRMHEITLPMEPFGSFLGGATAQRCLERLMSANVYVMLFVNAYSRYGSKAKPGYVTRPLDEIASMIEKEYRTAKANNLRILNYVAAENSDYYARLENDLYNVADNKVINAHASLQALRDEVCSADGVTLFDSPEDLANKIATDLYTESKRYLPDPLKEEESPLLVIKHQQVVDMLYAGELEKADELNAKIRNMNGGSPRANYNQACIYSLMAEREDANEKQATLLDRAEHFFKNSISRGILRLIRVHQQDVVDPRETVRANRGLKCLFENRPAVLKHLEQEHEGGIQLGGGCVKGDMQVSLVSGGTKEARAVEAGDLVMTWNASTDNACEGRVKLRKRYVAEHLIRFNERIAVTGNHPLLLESGWTLASNIVKGDRMQLATGKFEQVDHIEKLEGRFLVVDLTVTPTETFVINGVVVHNK